MPTQLICAGGEPGKTVQRENLWHQHALRAQLCRHIWWYQDIILAFAEQGSWQMNMLKRWLALCAMPDALLATVCQRTGPSS